MSGHVWPVRPFLLLVVLLGSSPVEASVPLTVGKYSRWALRSQFHHCYHDLCQGCMRQNFADMMNPFDAADSENCEGIHEQLNPYFWMTSKLTQDDWVSFAILARRRTLEDTIGICRQSYLWTHCTPTVGSTQGEIPGGYLVGTEFELGELDRRFIDRWRTGPDTIPTADLDNYVQYCWMVLRDFDPWGSAYWHYATHAAALYLADAVMGGSVLAKQGVTLSAADLETAQRVFIHGFVAQQSWELGSWDYPREEDLLRLAGIQRIPFARDHTPSFYYEIRAAIDHIFPVPVTGERSSWGRMKSHFEGGRER